ncbi:hypothetical protein HU200_052831 [Digitaria exilis]|uniref:MATH domain-containing protein n=1 Tax=Digitaria exilis TaxID=1010633 RepID=A0A835E3Z7_9POAL|nr:hypothetical protein HU200_052831 [Digitaria exilis]
MWPSKQQEATTFQAGGYDWQIKYEPYGYGNSWSDKYISVELVYGGKHRTYPLHFTFSLLDNAGKPVTRYSRSTPEVCYFYDGYNHKQGFQDFMERSLGLYAMLQFIYTDDLPLETMKLGDTVENAKGLITAAHRFELERLKMLCEEMLCELIDVNNVAGILVVAEEFAVPGNLKAVMETEGYEKMKAKCPTVLLAAHPVFLSFPLSFADMWGLLVSAASRTSPSSPSRPRRRVVFPLAQALVSGLYKPPPEPLCLSTQVQASAKLCAAANPRLAVDAILALEAASVASSKDPAESVGLRLSCLLSPRRVAVLAELPLVDESFLRAAARRGLWRRKNGPFEGDQDQVYEEEPPQYFEEGKWISPLSILL